MIKSHGFFCITYFFPEYIPICDVSSRLLAVLVISSFASSPDQRLLWTVAQKKETRFQIFRPNQKNLVFALICYQVNYRTFLRHFPKSCEKYSGL